MPKATSPKVVRGKVVLKTSSGKKRKVEGSEVEGSPRKTIRGEVTVITNNNSGKKSKPQKEKKDFVEETEARPSSDSKNQRNNAKAAQSDLKVGKAVNSAREKKPSQVPEKGQKSPGVSNLKNEYGKVSVKREFERVSAKKDGNASCETAEEFENLGASFSLNRDGSRTVNLYIQRELSFDLDKSFSGIHPCVSEEHLEPDERTIDRDPSIISIAREISQTGKIAPHDYESVKDRVSLTFFFISLTLILIWSAQIVGPLYSDTLFEQTLFENLFADYKEVLILSLSVTAALVFVTLFLSFFSEMFLWGLLFAGPIAAIGLLVYIPYGFIFAPFIFVGTFFYYVAMRKQINFAKTMISIGARGILANYGLFLQFFVTFIPSLLWINFTNIFLQRVSSNLSLMDQAWKAAVITSLIIYVIAITCISNAFNTMSVSRAVSTWYFGYSKQGSFNAFKSVAYYGFGTAVFSGTIGGILKYFSAGLKEYCTEIIEHRFSLISWLTLFWLIIPIKLAAKSILTMIQSTEALNYLTCLVAGITTESFIQAGIRAFNCIGREGHTLLFLVHVLDRLVNFLRYSGMMISLLIATALHNFGFSFAKAGVAFTVSSWVVSVLYADTLWTSTMTAAVVYLEQRRMDSHDPVEAKRRSKSPLERELAALFTMIPAPEPLSGVSSTVWYIFSAILGLTLVTVVIVMVAFPDIVGRLLKA